ncbi:MAG: hypothetical protein A3G11_00700 [Candidatus Lloydbacteria bacterium RIFCSPLOWO2_12_FULL_51_9]|uniref:Uncharacterized protein n=2 Tax=Candidatus Lloydiibacteriota TaxID=1817910 RepID=A0A1G2DUL2_9BACT|nr:MAG: hypothetical protein A3J08_00095 [Candidatus Lloydbacteria bacterium RIFCSPLOWO2_02_FULL_51_11]OGZ17226.1 MAG: hypothetical protein A3G11_00700 [Candidatus Lloydbacteria bacterium RIFCSPLOWO2_12_FULL_51_9]
MNSLVRKMPTTAFVVVGLGGCAVIMLVILALSKAFGLTIPRDIGLIGAVWIVYWYYNIPKATTPTVK